MTQLNAICDTPEACACSDSGEECCCIHDGGRCVFCGARIVLVDFETGEELTN